MLFFYLSLREYLDEIITRYRDMILVPWVLWQHHLKVSGYISFSRKNGLPIWKPGSSLYNGKLQLVESMCLCYYRHIFHLVCLKYVESVPHICKAWTIIVPPTSSVLEVCGKCAPHMQGMENAYSMHIIYEYISIYQRNTSIQKSWLYS